MSEGSPPGPDKAPQTTDPDNSFYAKLFADVDARPMIDEGALLRDIAEQRNVEAAGTTETRESSAQVYPTSKQRRRVGEAVILTMFASRARIFGTVAVIGVPAIVGGAIASGVFNGSSEKGSRGTPSEFVAGSYPFQPGDRPEASTPAPEVVAAPRIPSHPKYPKPTRSPSRSHSRHPKAESHVSANTSRKQVIANTTSTTQATTRHPLPQHKRANQAPPTGTTKKRKPKRDIVIDQDDKYDQIPVATSTGGTKTTITTTQTGSTGGMKWSCANGQAPPCGGAEDLPTGGVQPQPYDSSTAGNARCGDGRSFPC